MEIDFNSITIKPLPPKTPFDEKILNFIQDWYSEKSTVSVQTSGSTGTPKLFEIEKSRMLKSAQKTCSFLNLKQGDRALLCLPVEYISGKMMVVRAIERKLKLYTEEPSLSPLKNLHHDIDFCAMTPLQVEHSLDKLHYIKKLIIGGAAVSETIKKKISEARSTEPRTGHIYETYGMSETLSHIALKELYPTEQTHFTLFDGIEIQQDSRKCLTIYAPEIHPEPLQTNDIVELKSPKEFRFLGRADNIINSGGAKIYPEELERLVKKEIPNEVVFIGIPDESLGQKLVLIIEGSESEQMKTQISQIHFPNSFQRPKEIRFIRNLPRTPNGKLNRRALPDLIIGKNKQA